MLVPGELIIKLTNDFPECAHCLLARGQGLARSTGRRTLDQIRLKHGIRHLQPLFDGEHGSERRRRAQQRFGRARTGSVRPDSVPALEHIYVIRVRAETDLTALAADLQRDPAVEWVEPNYIYRINRASDDQLVSALRLAGLDEEPGAEISNDPFLHSSGSWGQSFPDLWGLFQIGAPAAWEISQGDDVVVAVIDSGLDITHPDIAANVWVNEGEIAGNGIDDDGNGFVDDVYGWDFTRCEETYLFGGVCSQAKEPGPDVSDPNGHGTHMAGIIAAVPDNELGMIGVAPRARVMAVKGLDRSGSGHGEDLAEALVYAAENGARVINASWAGPPSRTIETAIQYITATFDVVVVASVGNDAVPLERGVYPANLASVIAVGGGTMTPIT